MGIRDSLSGIRKALTPVNKGYTDATTRPSVAQPYMSTDTGAKLPIFPFPLIMIYELADNIDAIRIPIETLNREMFKNGFEIVERFKYKCDNCSKEFQYAPNIHEEGEDKIDMKKVQCDSCGSYDMKRPVPEHRKILEDIMSKPVNGNMQNMEDLSRQLERDLEIADNAYLLMLKNYFIDDVTGETDMKKTEIKELLRIDPPQVAMIADSDGRIGYDDKRQKIWKAGKYKPSLIYGLSPIFAIWSKAMSLSHMDEYVRKYFDKMRPPRGLLVVASRNYETFRKSWDALEQKATEDPYMIHPLMVESDKGGKNMANWIDFTGSLQELQFIEVRKELRQIIGAVYGVLPLYYGEMVGGWSQEGLQVTITNRAVKWGQDILYKAFFKKFAEVMGVDDWDLKLVAGEENDKLSELQREGVEIDNMAKLQQMGFKIERTHTGEYNISKEVQEYENPELKLGRGRETAAPEEQRANAQGEHVESRPSDMGGVAQGSPSSGTGTSMSQKNYPNGITPTNFDVVKKTLQTAMDFGWKKTKTVEELRKYAGMTVRNARDIVNEEFGQVQRWDDEENN